MPIQVIRKEKTSVFDFDFNSNEVDLKKKEVWKQLAKKVSLLSYIDVHLKRCIVLDEKTVRV